MTFDTNWCTLVEAVEKYGLEKRTIEGWVEDGLVRAEEDGRQILRIHTGDLELKLQEMTGI